MTEFIQSSQATQSDHLSEAIEAYLRADDKIALLRLIQGSRSADVAQALDELSMTEIIEVFKTLLISDVSVAAEVLIELEPLTIAQLHENLTVQEWAWIFAELADDDVVAILDLLPEDVKSKLVARMPVADKEDVLELMTYPEDSAGRIMTNEFLAIDIDQTVSTTVELIRRTRDFDPANLFHVYVTSQDRLVGVVTLRRLLLSKKADKLGAIMSKDVTAVTALMDQKEVAEMFRKHDEVTVPVLDQKGTILGIITVDDVIDVIDEESEEDIFTFIGTSDEELLVGNDVRKIVWLRLPWIFAALFGSLIVSTIMGFAESHFFLTNAAKVFVFVPLVCGMSGNVGVQSSTIMSRYLSSTQLNWGDALLSTFKEARVGLILGSICGVTVGLFSWAVQGRAMMVTVMIAMLCAMTTAATTGTIIPVLMKRLGFDPALATGPFVTSFNDVLATIVYFSIASVMMT